MTTCLNCLGTSPDDATFCIECGKPIKHNPYVEGTKKLFDDVKFAEYGRTLTPFPIPTGAPYPFKTSFLSDDSYYIYKAELPLLFKDEHISIEKVDGRYNIYYYGRKVIFID